MVKDSMSFLAELFRERICNWPSHSPDLSLLHFSLRSYLKNIVCKDAPRSIAKFKKKIEDVIREVNTTMCRMVFANLLKRAFLCPLNGGDNFEHLL